MSQNFSSLATVVTSHVEQPLLDDRKYRVIRLANDLEALLIHDAETDKASAALDVNVGSFGDPDDLYGLAHFCEHLLFMGTEKYPSENQYSQYLSEHSGHSNAYTSTDETNYFFEVSHEYFEGALDRFAQFFISPLFSPDCKDREIRAVDSENKKNLQSDMWRLHQLERSLSNPNHPYVKFSTGNLQTLDVLPNQQGLDVRDELLKFYYSHYSSNLMKLVVIGREDLNTLETWVVEKFSDIKNTNRSKPKYTVPALTSNQLLKFVKAKPVMDTKHLHFVFPVPDQHQVYDSKPGKYYSHIIGHEGSGSLYQYLKNLGWATSLAAGAQHVAEGDDFFIIDVALTDEGIHKYREIVTIVFEYLKLLSITPAQKWIFEELRDIAEVNFKFQQKNRASSTTSSLSSVMQRPLPRDKLLSHSLFLKFDPQLIEEFGSHLNASNFKLTLVAQELDGLDQQEKWYGTEYSIEDIDQDWLEELRSVKINPDMSLPSRNEFIPTDFEVNKKTIETPLKRPNLIRNNDQIRVWHKKDDIFWIPKGSVRINLKNPLSHANPLNEIRTSIFADLITDSLEELTYDADVAGLSYSVDSSKDGLEISVDGYNHKLPILLEKILQKIHGFKVDSKRFDIIKERNEKAYRNFGYSVPYSQIGQHFHYLLSENSWTIEEKGEELKLLTSEDIDSYHPQLLRNLEIEILVFGNLNKEEALNIADNVIDILKPSPLAPSQRVAFRSYYLPRPSSFYQEVTLEDKNNINSCIDYMLQTGKLNNQNDRAILEVIDQIGKEPAFNRLRTKEQLGYVVFSGARTTRTSLGYRILIQSERSTEYLESRIDEFLSSLGGVISGLSDSEFRKNIEAIRSKKLEKNKNLKEEMSLYWRHIRSGYYNFFQRESDAEYLLTVSKQDVLDVFNRYINPESKQRSKLVVHLKSQSTPLVSQEASLGTTLLNLALNRKIEFSSSDIEVLATSFVGKDMPSILTLVQESLQAKGISVEDAQKFVKEAQISLLEQVSGQSLAKYPEGTAIKDIASFKSGMILTEAPSPIEDLAVFVETEAKL